MKRHKKLIEFSKEHHPSLVLCLKILRHPEQNFEQEISAHFGNLLDHFEREERAFVHLWKRLNDPALEKRFKEEHQILRELHQNPDYTSKAWNQHFAEALRNHARFEERELFPALEQYLNEI